MARQNRKQTTVADPTLARFKCARVLAAEGLGVDVSELLAKVIKQEKVSPDELARRMGTTTEFVQYTLLEEPAQVELGRVAAAFAVLGYGVTLSAERFPKEP